MKSWVRGLELCGLALIETVLPVRHIQQCQAIPCAMNRPWFEDRT